MWQRRQTLFLLLAIVFAIVCLCLPVGHFEPQGMGLHAPLYNLWLRNTEGGVSLMGSLLFALLLLTCSIGVWAILRFHNRPLQARLCVMGMLLLAIWYAAFFFYAYHVGYRDYTFRPDVAACLPFVSMVFYGMARHSILADEKLVRAADRIR